MGGGFFWLWFFKVEKRLGYVYSDRLGLEKLNTRMQREFISMILSGGKKKNHKEISFFGAGYDTKQMFIGFSFILFVDSEWALLDGV